MDLSSRLRGINLTNAVVYSLEPRAEVPCLQLNCGLAGSFKKWRIHERIVPDLLKPEAQGGIRIDRNMYHLSVFFFFAHLTRVPIVRGLEPFLVIGWMFEPRLEFPQFNSTSFGLTHPIGCLLPVGFPLNHVNIL